MADTIHGTIHRITFYNPDNGYSVIKIIPDEDHPATNHDGLLAVVGIMPELSEGETIACTGQWVENPVYGLQFKADAVTPIAPRGEKGIISYIADTVYGIGEATARKIYDHFGEDTLTILDADPHRIHEAPIKSNLADNLVEAWQSNRAERHIMVQLQEFGISGRLARRIYKSYGATTLTILQSDPYQMSYDIDGIGFKKADDIAIRMGTPTNARQRLRAGLRYALIELSREGHTYAPHELLVEKTIELLHAGESDELRVILKELLDSEKLYRMRYVSRPDGAIHDAIYLPLYYHSEIGASDLLHHLTNTPSKLLNSMGDTHWQKYLAKLAQQNHVQLTDEQQSAVKATLTSKLSVLTGGPGTGKTTTLRMVIHALEQEGITYALCSPTGRAAKRLAEATERDASTIHRLLGYQPEGGFAYDENDPLQIDMLIVDEASMIDAVLFYQMLKALRGTTHLMLVGDVDQLPSVGAGNVLNDVIASGIAHVTRLQQTFRQDETSHIILNAHRINQGEMPNTDNQSRDFFFFGAQTAEEVQALVVDVVCKRIPQKFGFDALHDVQVLAPMYRGAGGVNQLNSALQETLNPDRMQMSVTIDGRTLRVGDKVMQTKNRYELDVFNGDMGFVQGFDEDKKLVRVLMDGRFIDYAYDNAEDLIHAYCISTHRSQGSEYPVVVMPVLKAHYLMLQRNLLYTAITRAKQMVVLIGQREAIRIAVQNNKVAERYSGLLPLLRGDQRDERRLF